jgi:hypothetical protein
MILYVNGCSHTWGAVVEHDETYPHIVFRSLVGDDYITFDINSKHKNTEEVCEMFSSIEDDKHYLINASTSGKGNTMIYQQILHHILLLESFNKKIDFCIAQFSGENRNFYVLPSGDYHHISPHDEPEKGLLFNPVGALHSIINIYAIQEILKSKNINYTIIPFHQISSNSESEKYENSIFDFSKFTCGLEGHRYDFIKRGLVGDNAGHVDYFGNYLLASLCLDVFGYEDSLIGFEQCYKHGYGNMVYQNLGVKKWIRKHMWELGDEAEKDKRDKIKD